MQGAIEIIDGKPSFNIEGGKWRGDGSERIGYDNGPRPYVQFRAVSVQHGAESLNAGKPVFKSIVYMKLQHPGERDFIDRPATREDAQRFSEEYRAYCQGREDRPDGAPLEVLFPNHGDVVSMLHFHRIYTVEMLARLNDTQLQNIGMGGYEWQQKARRWLDAMEKGDKGFAALEEQQRKLSIDNTRLREQNSAMNAQIQGLTNQIASLTNTLMQMGVAAPGTMIHGLQGMAPAMVGNTLGADEHVYQAPAPGTKEEVAELMSGDVFQEDLKPVTASEDEPRRGPGRPRRN
jgi:hypothetical protein